MTGAAPELTPETLPPEWGGRWETTGLHLRPCPTPDTPSLDVPRLRCGRAILALRLRRRGDRVVLRVAKRFGPDLELTLAWGGPEAVDAVLVDEHPLGTTVARLAARHEHEVQFLFVPR